MSIFSVDCRLLHVNVKIENLLSIAKKDDYMKTMIYCYLDIIEVKIILYSRSPLKNKSFFILESQEYGEI